MNTTNRVSLLCAFILSAFAAAGADSPADEAFVKSVSAMQPEQQVQAVVAKLKELNPAFDGKETHKIESGAVTTLSFSTVGVTDISPVKALQWLRTLNITPPTLNQKGLLTDLSPLNGLQLTWLWCHNNPITDLSPLKGMPLTVLSFSGTRVSDLSPLAGMKLQVLSFNDTVVSDMAALEGMPLTVLWCNNTKVTDLTPVKAMPLREIKCDFVAERDAAILRGIRTLAKINDMTAAAFWAKLGPVAQTAAAGRPPSAAAPTVTTIIPGRGTGLTTTSPTVPVSGPPFGATSPDEQVRRFAEKMKELNPKFDGKVEHEIGGNKVIALKFSTAGVTDISPVSNFRQLRKLQIYGGGRVKEKKILVDISPLRGLRLEYVECPGNQISDLSPFRGMPIGIFRCFGNPVKDLSPLKGMPLSMLACQNTEVSDLSPLKNLPLKDLQCQRTQVTDFSPVRTLPRLRGLSCDFVPDRDTTILRSVKTLETVNGLPTAEFWKRVEAGDVPRAR